VGGYAHSSVALSNELVLHTFMRIWFLHAILSGSVVHV